MTFAVIQRWVKGSVDGEFDADLLRTNDSHFRVNSEKQLELDIDVAVSDGNLPAIGDAANDVAPSQRATRQAFLDLDAVGRLLPATAGDPGTYLRGDKTFGPLPAQYTRTTLSFGDLAFNPAHNTDSSPNNQTHLISGSYDIDDYDLLMMYMGDSSTINNYSQMRTWNVFAPQDLAPETIGPDNAPWTPARKRYMRGIQVRFELFDSASANRPIDALFSVARTTAGLIRINAIRFEHHDSPQNYFAFNGTEEVRYGLFGVNF